MKNIIKIKCKKRVSTRDTSRYSFMHKVLNTDLSRILKSPEIQRALNHHARRFMAET